jgi:hypothetical protein
MHAAQLCYTDFAFSAFALPVLPSGSAQANMSQQAQQASHHEAEGDQAACGASPSFLSLPDPVVAHIVQCCKQETGHPMLGLSRRCRDAVLKSFSTTLVSLGAWYPGRKNNQSLEPSARLLHRTCTLAVPGTTLELKLHPRDRELPKLLQLGIESGGWGNIYKLKVG